MLLGSHNLSQQAWGVLQNKGSREKSEQLYISIYELSVLLLPSLEQVACWLHLGALLFVQYIKRLAARVQQAYRQHRHFGFSCIATQQPMRPPAAPPVTFWVPGAVPPDNPGMSPLPFGHRALHAIAKSISMSVCIVNFHDMCWLQVLRSSQCRTLCRLCPTVPTMSPGARRKSTPAGTPEATERWTTCEVMHYTCCMRNAWTCKSKMSPSQIWLLCRPAAALASP